jgi:hypothetical protein
MSELGRWVEGAALVEGAPAPVNLGYASFPECVATVRAGVSMGHSRFVLTNPFTTMGFSDQQLDEILAAGDVTVELTCYSLHPAGSYGGGVVGLERAARLIQRIDASRVVLSSDGGMANAPAPPALLAWGCEGLASQGIGVDLLRRLVQTNPAALVGVG